MTTFMKSIMQSEEKRPEYPDWRHDAEADRLYVQQCLMLNAFGGKLLLCPLDTTRPNLRILDSGTANGQFLYSLIEDGHITHPETAELIGTDIKPFRDTIGLPRNITISTQDILKPWPSEWDGNFDLVHMRNTLANTGTFDGAVSAVRRLVDLVKTGGGGYIQLVDGKMTGGPIDEVHDPPSIKLFKIMHDLISLRGMNVTLGGSVDKILSVAATGDDGVIKLKNFGSFTAVSVCGKGAATKQLEEMGYRQIQGLYDGAMFLMRMAPQDKRPVTLEQLEDLFPDLMREAEEGGVKIAWYAAWAERV